MNTIRLLLIFILSISQSICTNTDQFELTTEQLYEHDVYFVDFVFFDLLGQMHEITLPIEYALAAFKKGLKFDGSSIAGCSKINQSDMHLSPDISTVTILPMGDEEHKTARVICDIYTDEHTPYEGCPRNLLKRLMHKVHARGYEFYVGPELEFFLFTKKDDGNFEPIDLYSYCKAEGNLNRWADKREIITYLREQNINIEKLHHEVAQGQHELVIHYDNALAIADQVVLARHALQSICPEADMFASFMPKPLAEHNGSAMHIHFSLYDMRNKKNLFCGQDTTQLSPLAHHFLAGVLNRVQECTVLLNPTINSYKRLIPNHEAPIFGCWARKNRSALIRIPAVNDGESVAVRAELRSPDSLCNPYLAFAFILHAGLEGIENKEVLHEPVEQNLYGMAAIELEKLNVHSLPSSLEHALALFARSSFAQELLGTTLFDQFIVYKQKEIKAFAQAITNWEYEHYL